MSFWQKLKIRTRNKWHDSTFKSNFLKFIFWLTIVSLFAASYLSGIINNLNDEMNLRYISYVYLVMSVIPISSIILGIKYRKIGYNCKRNIIAGVIVLFIMLTNVHLGFVGQKMNDMYTNKDYSYITDLESIINFDLPKDGKIKTYKFPVYNGSELSFSDVIFNNSEEIEIFDNTIKESNLWTNKRTSYLELITSRTVWSSSDWSQEYYYLVYNADLKTYNEVPKETGKYHSYFLRYNMTTKEMFISEYILDFVV